MIKKLNGIVLALLLAQSLSPCYGSDPDQRPPVRAPNLSTQFTEDHREQHNPQPMPAMFSSTSGDVVIEPYRSLSPTEVDALIQQCGLRKLLRINFLESERYDQTARIEIVWSQRPIPGKPEKAIDKDILHSFQKEEHISQVLGISQVHLNGSYQGLGLDTIFNHTHETRNVEHKRRIHLLSYYRVPKVKISLTDEMIQIPDAYITRLREEVRSNDHHRLIRFFDEYGFFVPMELTLGGAIHISDTRDFDERIGVENYRLEFTNALNLRLELEDGPASGTIEGGTARRTRQTDTTMIERIRETKIVFGGDPSTQDSRNGWMASLNNLATWTVIGRNNLKPIYAFLTDDALRQSCRALLNNPSPQPTFSRYIVVSKGDDITSGQGRAPVKVVINNRTSLPLTLRGYNISYGKVVEEHQAPNIIAPNVESEFIASARKWALYGAEGEVVYKVTFDQKDYDLIFYWCCPLATDSEVSGNFKSSHQKIKCDLSKRTIPGNDVPSVLQFILKWEPDRY